MLYSWLWLPVNVMVILAGESCCEPGPVTRVSSHLIISYRKEKFTVDHLEVNIIR